MVKSNPAADTSAVHLSVAPRNPPASLPEDFEIRPLRHYERWVSAVIVAAIVAGLVYVLAGAQIRWSTIPGYFVSTIIIGGIAGTMYLTIGSMMVALVIGVAVAIARGSDNSVVRNTAACYVWLFRGIPALVLVLLWFNIALVIPHVRIPFIFDGSTNDIVTPFVAALLGLALTESAFMSEIIRAGIISVDNGQIEAAKSIGLSPWKITKRVVLPQTLKVVIPPTGNEFIAMLKYSSIAYVVAYPELASQSAKIYTENLQVIEVLVAASVWYVVLTSIFSVIQHLIEKRLKETGSGRPLAGRILKNFSLRRAS
jgi:polar amino acid transport system permease protein